MFVFWFLERRNRDVSHSDDGESSGTSPSSVHSSPSSSLHSSPSSLHSSPSSSLHSSSSSSPGNGQACLSAARLSLSSPELLSQLKTSGTSSLRHVPAPKGLTTVFCGRGRGQVSGPAPSTPPANQKTQP
ncbi:hypothetical protein EYF80_064492 [Liparis tanakae]|uniref:Uncharacterized protein n=1 Tax=Liparis tanakae TaxID=230148 RepID=A0A4Z2EA04_9TELE|nr:hypothetical protein EYF80_064492 [Liparis tanakae]